MEIPLARQSAREMSSQEARPSGRHLGEEEVNSNEIEVVYIKDIKVVES